MTESKAAEDRGFQYDKGSFPSTGKYGNISEHSEHKHSEQKYS